MNIRSICVSDNLFLSYFYNKEENDPLVTQSEKELTEVMDNFNELMDIKKYRDLDLKTI